jgi:hypothetical protein
MFRQVPFYKVWAVIFLFMTVYSHRGWGDCCCSKLPNRYGFDLPEPSSSGVQALDEQPDPDSIPKKANDE